MMPKEILETEPFPSDQLLGFSRRAQNSAKCLHLSITRMEFSSRFWPDQKSLPKKNTLRLLIDLFLFRKAEMKLMLYVENWPLLYC